MHLDQHTRLVMYHEGSYDLMVFIHELESRGRSYVARGGRRHGDHHQDNGQVKTCLKSGSPILVYGGASCESSPSGAQSRKVVQLEKTKIVII